MASKLDLTVSRIPDGIYMAVLDKADGTRVTRENVTFSAGKTTVNFASVNVGETIKGYIDDGQSIVTRAAYLEGVSVAVPKTLYVITQMGQSLSIGDGGTVTAPIFPGEISRANQFVGLDPWGYRTNTMTSTQTASLKPYKERSSRQTHGYSFMLGLKASITASDELLYMPSGIGGRSIAQLSKGTTAYSNFLTMLSAVSARATEISATPNLPFMDWIQGENDAGTARATYLTSLRTLHNDVKADVLTTLGQASIPLLLDQTGAEYGHDIAKTLFQYTVENNDAFMACPKYMLNRLYNNSVTDWVHLNSEGYVIQGEYHAIAGASIIANGSFKCLEPVSYAVVGNTIEITMNVPVGALVIDTTTLPACPGSGFEYIPAAGGSITPTVSVLGNKVILDVGQPPVTGDKIDCGYTLDDSAGHAQNLKIPCTNIRDSQSVSSSIAGYTLHNWLVQFDHVLP